MFYLSDYEITLSKIECSTVNELYENNGFFIVKPNKDISELINRQKMIENLFKIENNLEEKVEGNKNLKKMVNFFTKNKLF